MKNTKKRIEEVAVKLFNEYGYDNISLRDIAAASEIAIGNLTYYFRQKEDLLISIIDDLQMNYPLKSSKGLHGVALLENLIDAFISAQTNKHNNPFYYKNINELANDSPYIAEKTQIFQSQLYEVVFYNLKVLQRDGVIKEAVKIQVLESFSISFAGLSTTWLQRTMPYNNELITKKTISEVFCDLLEVFIDNNYQKDFFEICCRKEVYPKQT